MKIAKILFANAPSLILSLFFGLFSLGQLQRIHIAPSLAAYAHDCVLLIFITWAIVRDKKIQKKIKIIPSILKKIILRSPLEATWVLWIVAGMGMGFFTGTLSARSLLYAARLIAYITFIILVHANRKHTFSPRMAVAWLGVLMAGWGMAQYFLLPDTRFLHILGWDSHYYRLIGTFFDPAFMGMMLVLTLGVWQFPKISQKVSGAFHFAVQAILVVTIAATFSRASYLALAVLLILHVARKYRTALSALTFSGIFAMTLLLLPKPGGEGVNLIRTSTGEARLQNAQYNLITLQGPQWIWGRGLFNTDNTITSETPHHASFPDSLPVLLLNATGVGGFILTMLVAKKWLIEWWRTKPLWTTMLIATLVHSLFNNTLLQPFIFLTLGLVF